MNNKPAYTVQEWSGSAYMWTLVEGNYHLFTGKPILSTHDKGLASFAYWMKMQQTTGGTSELRLILEHGEDQPQIICANTPRGFEVGK